MRHFTPTSSALVPAAALVAFGVLVASLNFTRPSGMPFPFAADRSAVPSIAPVLAKAIPAVVAIRVLGFSQKPVIIAASSVPGGDPMLTKPEPQPFRSGGSGIIVDAKQGLIVTNNHVIADALHIEVGLSDGRNFPGKLLGTDPATDVAVVKIDAPDLTDMPLGDSDKLRVGDFVMAVGNPFGLESSASLGIVSATMRSDVGYEAFEDFIQTDAAVNPGNSGGALVDLSGHLVGINTAIGTDRAQGISFAIPINMARAIAKELKEKGAFRRGSVGFIPGELTAEQAAARKLNTLRGTYIAEIGKGTPAEKAGLKVGDIVVAANGSPVRGAWEFATRLFSTPIGKTMDLKVLTESGPRNFVLQVVDTPVEPRAVAAPESLEVMRGMELGLLLPGHPAYGKTRGVRVLKVGDGPLLRLGLKPDDVITAIDGTRMGSPHAVFETAAGKTGRYRLEVLRGDRLGWIYLGEEGAGK
jgi:S1-C subfamily serine protease